MTHVLRKFAAAKFVVVFLLVNFSLALFAMLFLHMRMVRVHLAVAHVYNAVRPGLVQKMVFLLLRFFRCLYRGHLFEGLCASLLVSVARTLIYEHALLARLGYFVIRQAYLGGV